MNTLNIVKLAKREDIFATKEDLKSRGDTVSVCYNINWSYFENLESIIHLATEVKKDFPNINDRKMDVKYIPLHSGEGRILITVICFKIPIEDFIQFRKKFNLHIM